MFATTRRARIAGVLVGYLVDLALGDPKRGHPVALFGQAAAGLERVTYRDSKVAGALHVGLMVAAVTLLGTAFRSIAATATATWICLGGTSLARTGLEMSRLLERGDVEAARRLLPSLCGRGPGIGRREHFRCPGGAAAMGDCGRRTGGAGVPGNQHAGFDDRPPFSALYPI